MISALFCICVYLYPWALVWLWNQFDLYHPITFSSVLRRFWMLPKESLYFFCSSYSNGMCWIWSKNGWYIIKYCYYIEYESVIFIDAISDGLSRAVVVWIFGNVGPKKLMHDWFIFRSMCMEDVRQKLEILIAHNSKLIHMIWHVWAMAWFIIYRYACTLIIRDMNYFMNKLRFYLIFFIQSFHIHFLA